MFVELIAFALMAAFVGIVVLGHVVLAAAIIQCVREDLTGGRPRIATGSEATAAAGGLEFPGGAIASVQVAASRARSPSQTLASVSWRRRTPDAAASAPHHAQLRFK